MNSLITTTSLQVQFKVLTSKGMRDHSPPVQVKLPISKSQDFCPQVEERMEEPVKPNQPNDVIRDLESKANMNF
jgi:hypothetical protein